MSERRSWLQRLENVKQIDAPAESGQRWIRGLLERAPVVRGFLQGDWLDHPLHAAATDVPAGAFSASLVLDALSQVRRDPELETAADATAAIGLAGALAAAVPGLADWAYTRGGARRVGLMHGLGNLGVLGLYGASIAARRRQHRPLGIGLAVAGFSLLICSTWLGGELSYRLGVGVRPEHALRS